jgi:predicted MPP superfamily phosphohydrolase/DNA polymerase III delta prime subunit
MRILHLSDFHYKSASKDIASQNLLIEKLLDQLSPEMAIDFFLFTGDLVFSGKKNTDFNEAYTGFIKKIGEKLELKKRNFLICAGNHDVDRDKINDPIKQYVRGLKSSAEINKVIEENKEDVFGLSCRGIKNYYQFEKELYVKGEEIGIDNVNNLYTIHFREYYNWKIAFVSINTAWCSSGDDDKGNLFFPISELEKAINTINAAKVDWKILLLHHPLSYLRDFNRLEIEDLIYTEFHFMFSGHVHKREDYIRFTQNEGIFGTSAHAAFTKKEDGKIGFTILDVDLDTLEVINKKFLYDFEEKIFLPLKEMNFTFPCNEVKSDQIKILKTLRKRLQEYTDKANELCITTKDLNNEKGFLDLFVPPVLKNLPQVEAVSNLIASKKIEFSQLLNNANYLILGKDKTGKTSLLYKIVIELLKNFSHFGEIPFYINLAEYKSESTKLDIVKLLGKYLEHSYAQTESILRTYKLKILFDNFDPSKEAILAQLSSFFKAHPNCSYIILADQTLAQSYEKIDYGIDGYKKLFIHDISKSEIRELTHKWPRIPKQKQDEFVDKIVEVLKQHSMPFNFWTLSIFLWIFSGKNTLNFNNNSELLELYIDDILDRNKLASDPQNRFSYLNYKLLLSELARKLLLNHLDTNYSIKYSEFIVFTEDFKSQNLRRVGKTSEIVEHLMERGILKKLEDDYVTFRLNGVFEYFIAYGFIENTGALKDILNDDNVYLSFKNEFEIYSGFPRTELENRNFLNEIYQKTKIVFSELNKRFEDDLDMRLKNALSNRELIDVSRSISEVATSEDLIPLTNKEKDDIFDEFNSNIFRDVEVTRKKLYDISIKNFDVLERYLIISGRVFKNIDNIKDSKFIGEIFDFIMESSCNLGFLLLEELEEDEKNTGNLDRSSAKKLAIQLISNYLPSVVQTFVQDSMGHINLEVVIINRLNELKANAQVNQYKIFILYSLLLDIDLKKYKHLIDELISVTKLSVIRSSILIKLFYLLLFKSYDDDKMISFLKEKIRQLNIQLNPKVDMGEFDRKFEETQKMLLIKRQVQ